MARKVIKLENLAKIDTDILEGVLEHQTWLLQALTDSVDENLVSTTQQDNELDIEVNYRTVRDYFITEMTRANISDDIIKNVTSIVDDEVRYDEDD